MCVDSIARVRRLAHVYHDGRLAACQVVLGRVGAGGVVAAFGASVASDEFAAGYARQLCVLEGMDMVMVATALRDLARA